MDKKAPVFVKIDDYKDISDIINLTRSKIKQAKYLVAKIRELKSREDTEISRWESELNDVENKVEAIDKTLFEPMM
jgi:predicted  nucleic acid-binding Zn-ribbon protein